MLNSLTFSFRQPDKENVGIVNNADNGRYEDNKDVANDDLGAHG